MFTPFGAAKTKARRHDDTHQHATTRGREDAIITVLFTCTTAPDSWISRVLKKKKKKPKADGSSSSSSSERKSKTTDPYEGINDFSEVAAVWDYYEARMIYL